jgi:broad specificity phosphatase PhoE
MSSAQTKARTRVLFIRRPATELDDQDRICGSLDLPLSDEGLRQADRLAELLSDTELTCIVAAAGNADQQAAKVIGAGRKIKVRSESSWQNLDHGLWHGCCIEELKTTHPRYYRQWQEHPESIAPPSGETTSELLERIKPAFCKLMKKRAGESIAIIAPDPLLTVLRGLADQANCECPQWQEIAK